MIAQELDAFPKFVPEALLRRFGSGDIRSQFSGAGHHVLSFAHAEVAKKGDDVGGEVDQQHAAQSDVVVDEAHDRARHQPATLNAGQEEGVCFHELALGREFLDQRGDGWPEHPEAGSNQSVHEIELPDLDLAAKRQNGNRQNHQSPGRVQHHHQVTPVFTINHDPREGKQQHGRQSLQDRQRAERHFGMGCLQNVPGDGGSVHSTAQHGDDVGEKYKTKCPLLQDGAHVIHFKSRRSGKLSMSCKGAVTNGRPA